MVLPIGTFLAWISFSSLDIICQLFSYSQPSPEIVNTGYVRYIGTRFPQNDFTIAFLGLQYAEPPLNEKRFRAPVSLNTTRVALEAQERDGLIDAREYPDFCIQGGRSGLPGGAGSEDCLKVNVYKSVNATAKSALPVLVFFHGGGESHLPIIFRTTMRPLTHQQSPNVVIVSVYYRLSSLGFLAHPELVGNLGDMNAGFLDQVEALRWVKRYIHAFGGDPDRVTIDGHSAGGSSIELHLVTGLDTGERLFTAAIAQSVYRVPVPTKEQQKELFEFYSSHAGCIEGTIAGRMDCLRRADVSVLAHAQDLADTPEFQGSYRVFKPVIDGTVVPDYPTRAIMQGWFSKVPLLIGATSNETSIPETGLEEGLRYLYPGLTDKDLEEFLEVYPSEEYDSPSQRFRAATGESVFICARTLMGHAFHDAGASTWLYRYNQPNPTLGSYVVAHSAESWMMFNGTNTGNNGTTSFSPLNDRERAFSEELIAYWISFVRSHDPNTFKLKHSPIWPGRSKEQIVLQLDGDGSYVESEDVNERKRCQFVYSKVEKEQN
uniref:Carboxylic ester hydrolase n=1 Tax=Moniliophthora roreri TaxID=221103 RepID=A0A0W0F7K6_MONRR